jgi:hypothetical protein
MINHFAPGAASAFALLLAAAAGTAAAQPMQSAPMLSATLSGPAEHPPGDPKGAGTAMLHIDQAKQEVCYELQVQNIAPATMAHIHMAPATESGPPVAELKAPGADGKSSGCVAAAPALLKGLTDNPSAYYVNVHNAEHPAGAVRGQLGK